MADAARDGGGPGRGSRRTDTAGPRRARERALKILFQADLRGIPADGLLERVVDDPYARALLDDVGDVDADGPLQTVAEPPPSRSGEAAAVLPQTPEIDGFTRSLVLGVTEHRDEVDALVARFARRWAIHRMPVVDRAVLRLATYELLYESTSPAVVLNEAIELAKALSTEDSGRYVNGVLESIRKDVIARRA